jgi:hypothetical protein
MLCLLKTSERGSTVIYELLAKLFSLRHIESFSDTYDTIELFFLIKLCFCIVEDIFLSLSGKNVLKDVDSANLLKPTNEFDFIKL